MSLIETIEIYAESVEDITPLSHDSLLIELSGVDLAALVQEIGDDEFLDVIGVERINEYLKDKEQEEEPTDE